MPAAAQPIRLLIIDLTLAGDGSATGELKAALFDGLDGIVTAQVYGCGAEAIGFVATGEDTSPPNHKPSRIHEIHRQIDEFAPQCVLYRPTPNNGTLHLIAMQIIQRRPLPLLTWIMDDWPARLKAEQPETYATMAEDLQWLFQRACRNLCISEAMREAFEPHYQTTFIPVANGIEPDDWPLRSEGNQQPFIVRYAGSLAPDMSLASVHRIANAIQCLADEGLSIRFEINTRPNWARASAHHFDDLPSCSITTEPLSRSAYRAFLQEASLLIIAYNFDAASLRYVRYSLANKLPESLASGTPVMLHGPPDVATISYMTTHLPDAVVPEPAPEALKAHIRSLAADAASRRQRRESGRRLALSRFRLADQRQRLRSAVLETASEPYQGELRRAARWEEERLNEHQVAQRLCSASATSRPTRLKLSGKAAPSKLTATEGWHTFHASIDPTDGAKQGLPVMLDQIARRSSQEGGWQQPDCLEIEHSLCPSATLRHWPWTQQRPGAVLYAVDGREPSWRQAADFLVNQGYLVLVSEWYPAAAREEQACWRSIRAFPCTLADREATGMVIALSASPDQPTLLRVIASAAATTAREASLRYRAGRAGRRWLSIGRNNLRKYAIASVNQHPTLLRADLATN